MSVSLSILEKSSSAYQDALILSDDLPSVNAIREFLVTNGCRIFTKPQLLESGSYLVVHGDYDFVKSSLANLDYSRLKILILLVNGSKEEVASFSYIADVKVVVCSEECIDGSATKKICTFFFTGALPVLWMIPPKKIYRNEVFEKKESSVSRTQTVDDVLRIRKTMEELFSPPTAHHGGKGKKYTPKKITLNPWMAGIFISVALFIVPILWFLVVFFGSIFGVFTSSTLLKQGDIERAKEVSRISSWSIRQSDSALTVVLAPVYLLGLESHIVFPERMVSLLRSVNDGLEEAYTSSDLGKQFFASVTSALGSENTTNDKAPLATMMKLKNELVSLYGTLGRVEADFVRLTTCHCGIFYLPAVQRMGESLTERISSLRSRISEASSLLSLYPQIGGFREKKVYLLLFQNSMELRPTGGFIGSLALVTFADGRLLDFSVEDVYTADGQLKGHVDPPPPISLLLGQEHWYLRDSNWNPDFRISGEKAGWFYEKEMGIPVNGVIGISLPFVSDLLGLVGPIDLPDGNDRITKDNFFAKSLYYTKDTFFPGSTQKKDFLGSLSRSLIDKLLHARSIPTTTLLSTLGSALDMKSILLYFSDPLLTRFVDQMGWSGSAPRGDACTFVVITSDNECISDGAMVVEANVGVNKVNYSVKRDLVHDISFSEEGSISETMTYTIKNTAGAEAYGVYLQVILPKDVSQLTFSLDGIPLAAREEKDRSKPIGPYVEEVHGSSGAKTFGVSLTVPVQEVKRLIVTYNRLSIVRPGVSTYGFLLTKQPGVDDMNTEIRLTYPLYWNARPVKSVRLRSIVGKSEFLAKNSQLVYNTVLSQDAIVAVSFSK
ncbi:DUF4012 domain-containing protein [Candidatus Gottesmanbacteria bacterium]|nr:DUF4012 domain-containing protein [Candidatus Gottesmanbacteria bacterium]